MFRVIIPKASFKELEKIGPENQKLIYSKIKDLQAGDFKADKALKGKRKESIQSERAIIE